MRPLGPEDPYALVGVGLDTGPDDEALSEMACCIVEEYARMGWSGRRILSIFRNPFYRGAHQILRRKGEEYVRGLIQAVEGIGPQARPPNGG